MNKITRKIGGNILRQDCFRLEHVDHQLQSPIPRQEKEYVELVKHLQPDGIKEVYERKEYPVTPEYVASFAVSTDYKKDPSVVRPISELPQGLGDVTNLQRFSQMDTAELERISRNFNEAVEQLKAKLEAKTTELTDEAKKEENK